jgi:hypothetical protein
VRGSFEEVVHHCLHEGSRIHSQSWEGVSLEYVGPSDDLAWTLFSGDLADSGPDLWGEQISWVELELKSYKLSQLRVTVSSPRKGRIALGLPDKIMPGGKVALPSRGIVGLVGGKSCVYNMV